MLRAVDATGPPEGRAGGKAPAAGGRNPLPRPVDRLSPLVHRREFPRRACGGAPASWFRAARSAPPSILSSEGVSLSVRTAPPLRLRPAAGDRQTGMATAEYALALVAACAFAAVLYAVLTSSEVRDLLTRMVVDALGAGG